MAVLALGLVGAAAAPSIGLSAGLGYLLGTTVGNLLFPPSGPDQVGPRLGDTSVSSSAYGNMIPINYGTVRIGGQMIWGTEIKEIEDVRRVGGKGGGGQKVTSYSYSSFALSFGEGVAEAVLKMWAGGKLIFDKTGTDPAALQDLGEAFKFRFYPGDETQLPDPLIAADVDGRLGADSTPAYRGQCYIVFEDLPLADFGNAIPQITVELAYRTDPAAATKVALTYNQASPTVAVRDEAFMGIDWDRRLLYVESGSVLSVFSINNGAEQLTQTYAFPTFNGLTVMPDLGGIIATDGAGNSRRINYIDPDSLAVTNQFGSDSSDLTNSITNFVATQFAVGFRIFDSTRGYRYLVACGSNFNDIGILDVPSMAYLWGRTEKFGTALTAAGPGKEGDGFSDVWFAAGSSLLRVRVFAGAMYSALLNGTRGVERQTFNPSGVTNIFQIFTDVVDGNLIITDGTTSKKLNSETGAEIWSANIAPSDAATGNAAQQNKITNQRWGFIHSQTSVRRFVILSTVTGEIIFDQDLGFGDGLEGVQTYNSELNLVAFLAQGRIFGLARLDKSAALSEVLSTIVSDLGAKVGYTSATEFDVTELTDAVPGFTLGRPATLRTWLELLAAAYFFEATQSDDLIKFRKKQKASIANLVEDDLLFLNESIGQVTNSVRAQEVDLPRRIDVRYIDKNKDYQAGLQSRQRIQNPTRTQNSNQIRVLELPIVMTAQDAKRIAERLLYEVWLERDGLTFSLPWRYLRFDPTDVITITQNGNTFVQRIAENRIANGFRLDMQAVAHESAVFDSTAVADAGTSLPQILPTSNITLLRMLDIPLLRPQDDTAGNSLRLHFAMSGLGQPSWGGALLLKGNDAITFETVSQSLTEATRVSALTLLPKPADPYATDNVSTVDIRIVTGDISSFSSITQLQLVNGGNPLLLGDEIIQFRKATVLSADTVRLSGLLRARRGTDYGIETHAVGEPGLLLTDNAVSSIRLDISELNTNRFYKGVGFGELEQATASQLLRSTGAAERPFSPANIKGAVQGNGDIIYTWFRRTRLDGSLRDSTNRVPLGETTEAYEVDIVARASGGVLRTFTGITSPTYTLTAAEKASIIAGGPFTSIAVTNPGAETGNTSGWTLNPAHGNNSLTTTTTQPHSGTRSFRITEFSLRAYYFQDITLSASDLAKIAAGQDQLSLKWWGISVPRGDGKTNQQTMRLECYDANDNLLANTTDVFHRDQTYTQYTLNLTAPAATTRVRLHIQMDREGGGHSDNDAKVYMDDITLEIGAPATNEVYFRAYQISAIVGRGFPAQIEQDL